MNKPEIAQDIMMNTFKILSAIFDTNDGEIILDKEVFLNADPRFYIVGRTDGDKIIFTKVQGKSELYYEYFPRSN